MSTTLADSWSQTIIVLLAYLLVGGAAGLIIAHFAGAGRASWLSTELRWRHLEPEQVPPIVRAFLDKQVNRLRKLGFEEVARLTMSPSPSLDLHSVVLREAGDCVSASVSVICEARCWTVRERYVSFRTELRPGDVLKTSNGQELPSLMPAAGHIFQFPEIEDLGRLYRIHRALVRRTAAPARPVPPPASADEAIEVTRRYFTEDCDALARAGYLRAADGGKSYQPTWKAILVGLFAVLPPVDRLGRVLRARRARKLLESLGV